MAQKLHFLIKYLRNQHAKCAYVSSFVFLFTSCSIKCRKKNVKNTLIQGCSATFQLALDPEDREIKVIWFDLSVFHITNNWESVKVAPETTEEKGYTVQLIT